VPVPGDKDVLPVQGKNHYVKGRADDRDDIRSPSDSPAGEVEFTPDAFHRSKPSMESTMKIGRRFTSS
jgi:hypothetical protein